MLDKNDANSGGSSNTYKKCTFHYYVMTDKQFQEMNNAVMKMVAEVLAARERESQQPEESGAWGGESPL